MTSSNTWVWFSHRTQAHYTKPVVLYVLATNNWKMKLKTQFRIVIKNKNYLGMNF